MIRNLVSTLTLVLVLIMLSMVVVDMPEFGSPQRPQANVLSERMIWQVVEDTGALNAISAIILDYRAYDTLGEATVLFVSIMATIAALTVGAKRPPRGGGMC